MVYAYLPFYFINVFIHACIYAFLVLTPFRSKLRYNLGLTTLLVLCWVLFTAVSNALFFEIDAIFSGLKLPMVTIWLTVSVITMLSVIKSNFLQLLFVLLVLFTFQNNLIMFARLFYNLRLFPPIFPQFHIFNYLLYTVVFLFLALPFLWFLFIRLFKRVVDAEIDFLQWKFLFILPLLYYSYFIVSRFGGINIPHPSIKDFIQLLLLNSAVYFSYTAVLKMLLKFYDNYKMNEQMTLMVNQLEMQKGQYEKLTEHIEKTARLRHDWRHHLLLIKDYTKQRDLEGLEHYLDHYFMDYTADEESPVCRNHSVDIILRHYLTPAKAAGIAVDISVDIPDRLSITDHHLCIIFGNLVENAVENCSTSPPGSRFISIKARPTGSQLAVMIRNSYSKKIMRQGDGFLSAKHEGFGIGISSVRNIAESYGGSLQVNYDGMVFKISVLLNI